MRDILQKFGLDFEVKALPLLVYNPDSEKYIESNKFRAITRPDNGHIYATCTRMQYILQNETLLDMLVRYFGREHVEYFKVVKSTINADECSIMIPNGRMFSGTPMEMESYFTVQKSFNQKYALRFGITDTVVECDNVFVRLQFDQKVSFRQTLGLGDLMDDFAEVHSLFGEIYKEHYGMYETLKNRVVSTKKTIYEFIDYMMGVDFSESTEGMQHRRLGNATDLKNSIAKSLRVQGNNYFGIFQGVTWYTTHLKGPKNYTEFDRLVSCQFGTSQAFTMRALAYLLDTL